MFKLNFDDIDIYNIGSWPQVLKIAVIIGSSVLVAGVFYWFFLSSQMEQLDSLIAEEQKQKQFYVTRAKLLGNIYEYKAQLKVINERLLDLVKLLPSENEVPNLVEQVTQAGRESGLKFKEIKMLPEKKLKYYVELPIEIKSNGTYHQIGEFLSKVSSLPRIITFHDFKLEISAINPNEPKHSPDGLELNILAKTYRYIAHNGQDVENSPKGNINKGAAIPEKGGAGPQTPVNAAPAPVPAGAAEAANKTEPVKESGPGINKENSLH